MDNRPEIIFSFPTCMGGVASLNYNLINYSKLKSNFFVKVILIKLKEDNRPVFLEKFDADETVLFEFSIKENQYYVLKKFSKLLGTREGAIVCDNLLTIRSAAKFSCPKTVFHYLHDFYYVKQNIEAGTMVDIVVTHSTFFADCAFAADPENFINRCFYIPYGVKQLKEYPSKDEGKLNLVFLGRLEDSKGVLLLYDINKTLEKEGVAVNWNIIGKGSLKKQLHEQWQTHSNITFYEPDTTEEVFNVLKKQDIFIFPTIYEGTPVSLLEAISCGVVTIVSDLPGGIRDIVKEGIGYRCELNNVRAFAEHIITLDSDRTVLYKMQQNCYNLAQNNFDIEKNADNYFRFFMKYSDMKRSNKKISFKMSRLDKPHFPNKLVKLIRAFK